MAILARNLLILLLAFIVLSSGAVVWFIENRHPRRDYSEIIEHLNNNHIVSLQFTGNRVAFTVRDGHTFKTTVPDVSRFLERIQDKNIRVEVKEDRFNLIYQTVVLLVLVSVVLVFWVSLHRRKQEKESKFASDKKVNPGSPDLSITFADVAGIPEAKEELEEVVASLKYPENFKRLGANIPKGILLQGPPGTGKTMLAKAIAGEAGVPFYSFSGSDFVEMFVGVGASRVRDLFREAKENAPCIVFIDEIDAVGANRANSSAAGGQEERGQTLNALLVEMDGFSSDDTIVVLAATNRPDILDPALRRPGRFDRQINIQPPDVKGRIRILGVHTQKVKLAPEVEFETLAKVTPGFTGAELANLVNEAALMAARQGKEAIDNHDFDMARDRILMGVERKGLVMTDKDREVLAFHEAGHAIVAKKLPESDPLHKITIIPRGMALGQTQQMPMNDRHAYSFAYLRNRITILMGGRAAEEIIFSQRTTGSQSDLLAATRLASDMVCKWGMSEKMGPQAFEVADGSFLGGQSSRLASSQDVAKDIDKEIRQLLASCYDEAVDILLKDQCLLKNLAEILLQVETLDAEEFDIIRECSIKKEAAALAEEEHTSCQSCSVRENCSQGQAALQGEGRDLAA